MQGANQHIKSSLGHSDMQIRGHLGATDDTQKLCITLSRHTCPVSLNHLFHLVPQAPIIQGSRRFQGLKRSQLAAGPVVPPFLLWNNLPADIRQTGSIEAFKSKLIKHLFDLAFN